MTIIELNLKPIITLPAGISSKHKVIGVRFTKKKQKIRDIKVFHSTDDLSRENERSIEQSGQKSPYWTHWQFLANLKFEYAGDILGNNQI